MKATRPGLPANGAISATLDIECPHRLQVRCASTFMVLPFELGLSVLLMRVNKPPAESFYLHC